MEKKDPLNTSRSRTHGDQPGVNLDMSELPLKTVLESAVSRPNHHIPLTSEDNIVYSFVENLIYQLKFQSK